MFVYATSYVLHERIFTIHKIENRTIYSIHANK